MAVTFINPATLAEMPPSASQAAVVTNGTLIAVSGQVSTDKDGNLVGPGDIEAQARQVFDNMRRALEAAGATLDDVFKLNVYLVDLRHTAAMRAIRHEYFPNTRPASTVVGVTGLTMEGLLIEVEGMAVINA